MNDVAVLTELTSLRTLAHKASLTPEAKHITLWCVDQLPGLYEEYRLTNESRFADTITRLAQAVLKRLGEADMGSDAGKVANALVTRLNDMHERLGLTPLRIKLVAAAPPPRVKKVKAKVK